MKINDKSLSTYSRNGEGIDKEGYLKKKGELNHSYKRRWFVLKGNLLFYFEMKNDKQPLGMIILENCSVEVSDNERYSFCVRFQAFGTAGASRTYILCADNELDMEQWMKYITSASYCYVKMLVTECEKQLEELKLSNQANSHSEALDKNQPTLLSLLESNSKTNLKDMTDASHRNSTPLITKSSFDIDTAYRTKNSYDMYTTTTSVMARSKSKTLSTMKRTKSAESLDKYKLSKSPQLKRKANRQTLKHNFAVSTETVISDEFERTTFDILHTSFGAAIWTKIGETL